MLYNVPQYVDVEDKVAGPLTAKQLLWMFGLGAVILVLWNLLDRGIFWFVAIPVALAFVALAFYKPYNQPLINFVGHAVGFIFKPKVYIWKRVPEKPRTMKTGAKPHTDLSKEEYSLSSEEVSELAKILDSDGQMRNDRILEIIKSKKAKIRRNIVPKE